MVEVGSSIVVLLLLAIVSPSKQLIQFGRCPLVTIQKDFDVDRFTGKWYEIWKNPNINQFGGSCTTAEYTKFEDQSITVKNTQIVPGGSEKSIMGSITVLQSGILGLRFPSMPNVGEAKLYVVDTDYENYVVLFTCGDFLRIINGQTTWILTRERIPTKETLEKAYAAMRLNSLPLIALRGTSQKDCPELASRKKKY